VRILLPPSEGKRPGGDGPPLRSTGLGSEPLAATRRRIVDAVRRLCDERPEEASALLRLPPAVAADALSANSSVWDAPTLPALDRFIGTLYDALDVGSLPRGARRRAAESVLVFDGAFGVLAGDEPVPDHRVPAAGVLPDLGTVAGLWRPVLDEVLPALLDGHLVVDLRSSDYAAMWRGGTGSGAGSGTEVVPVRILVEQRGRHAVLSVPSKVGKGLLARALCTTRRQVRTARDLRAVALAAGFTPLTHDRRGLDLAFDFVPKTPVR
jgi:cytoplasmic iron level regulating protein YaaA (DUF328/UPF0246 family)